MSTTELSTVISAAPLPTSAVEDLEVAQAALASPDLTPGPDAKALKKVFAGAKGGDVPVTQLLSGAPRTAPTPGDAALVGELVRRRLPRQDVVVEGDAKVSLNQGQFPPTGQVCVNGSLTVRGNLQVVAPLVVVGDLEVTGTLRDMGPQSVVVVLGTLRCRALVSTGEVFVTQDLRSSEVVWGHYNDNSLEVKGTLAAPVVISADHAIEAGSFEVGHRPPEGGSWGPEVFDARDSDHVARLAELATDASVVEDGQLDIDRLVVLPKLWRA